LLMILSVQIEDIRPKRVFKIKRILFFQQTAAELSVSGEPSLTDFAPALVGSEARRHVPVSKLSEACLPRAHAFCVAINASERLLSAEAERQEREQRGEGRFRHDFEGRVRVLHRAAVGQGVFALDHVAAVGQEELQRAVGEEEVLFDEVPAAVVGVFEGSVV